MDMQNLPLKPERKAEVEAYAKLHDQTPEDALDYLVAAQLAWEKREFYDTVQSALRGYEDVKDGRTKPAGEVREAPRRKSGR
jgi:hypothetical protein